jgi:hypothetical protein
MPIYLSELFVNRVRVNDFRRNRTLLNTFQSISGYKLVVSHKEVMSVNRRNTIGTPAILIRVLLISGDSLMMEGGTLRVEIMASMQYYNNFYRPRDSGNKTF